MKKEYLKYCQSIPTWTNQVSRYDSGLQYKDKLWLEKSTQILRDMRWNLTSETLLNSTRIRLRKALDQSKKSCKQTISKRLLKRKQKLLINNKQCKGLQPLERSSHKAWYKSTAIMTHLDQLSWAKVCSTRASKRNEIAELQGKSTRSNHVYSR